LADLGWFFFRLGLFNTADRAALAETAAKDFAFFRLLVASTHVFLLAVAGLIFY
jgi:hypothetical protein